MMSVLIVCRTLHDGQSRLRSLLRGLWVADGRLTARRRGGQ